MKTVVYYFSGTGNCLWSAREIAEGLGGEPKPVGLEEKTDADIVGIVFPVHCLRAPQKVRAFSNRLKCRKDAYIFAVATCGAIEGNALQDIRAPFSIGFVLYLPDNSILFPTPKEKHQAYIKKARKDIKEMLVHIKNREKVELPKRAPFYDFLGWFTMKFIRSNAYFQKAGRKCNLCGTCVKTCPVSNISIRKKKVRFHDRCQLCFGCIHACPKRAITFGLIRPKEKKIYFHPDTKPEEIGNQASTESDAKNDAP